MVKIRLAKVGRKNDPFYRVVAIDEAKKNIGRALAVLGYWNPRKKLVDIKKDQVTAWTLKGAQVSAAVKKLLEK